MKEIKPLSYSYKAETVNGDTQYTFGTSLLNEVYEDIYVIRVWEGITLTEEQIGEVYHSDLEAIQNAKNSKQNRKESQEV